MFENLSLFNQVQLSPIIKWAGGKEKEQKHIFPAMPASFRKYYEPFVGGGSIYTAIMNAEHLYINDKSDELMSLYMSIASQNTFFFNWLDQIVATWSSALKYSANLLEISDLYARNRNIIEQVSCIDIIENFIKAHQNELSYIIAPQFIWDREFFQEIFKETVCRKMLRMQELEKIKGELPFADVQDNILTALMGSVYMYFRKLYNNTRMDGNRELHTALFVFIRNYAYSGMFRYSKNGDFNVPYGGIGYNKKNLVKKIEYYKSSELLQHMSKTTMSCADFMDFFEFNIPQEEDFIFLDPPYDSEFSTYAQNEFTRNDQQRLADYLCNNCKAKWLLIIKNTPFIKELYTRDNLFISSFDKTYQVSFMNRNNRQAEHLLIANYPH